MKNILKSMAALIIAAACLVSFCSCVRDSDGDGIHGDDKNGTDNVFGDGGSDSTTDHGRDSVDDSDSGMLPPEGSVTDMPDVTGGDSGSDSGFGIDPDVTGSGDMSGDSDTSDDLGITDMTGGTEET